MRRLQAVVILLAGMSASAALAAGSGGQEISEAWIAQPPKGVTVTAGYFTIRNDSSVERRLLAVQTPVSEVTELHSNTMQDGKMKMRPVDEVPVPAGGTVTFSPSGYHLMLIGVRQPLEDGQTVPVQLTLDGGESVTHSFTVRHRD